MIKHVVMFKIKPELGSEKENIKKEIKKRLEALPSKIAQIKGFEIGLNVKESERSTDIVLISEFESLDSLQEYAVHPDHLEVTAYIRDVCDKLVANDFEY